MLAKKPIIHSVSAGNDLVNDAGCGVSVAAEDVNAIVAVIKELSQMSESDLNKFGNNGYDYVLANHDYKILANKFLFQIK